MNFQQLEYIVAIDQFKSFSKAAEHCNVTQATLSAMVKKLEEELNVILFDRKAYPIITTDMGLEIILQAKKVLYESSELKNLVQVAKKTVAGHVKIGIIPTVANALLPKILKPTLEKYPQLYVHIVELTTQNLIKQLKEGNIDIGILATPLQIEEIEENILYYETLMVYGSFESEKKYLLPEELKDHKIWMLEEGHCLREQFIQLCSLKEKKLSPHNFHFEANSFETLLNLVDEFGGLTLIPELYYQTLQPSQKQKVCLFKSPIPVREISLVYFRPFAKNRIIEALTNDIKNIVNQKLISNNYSKNELIIVPS